MANVSLSSAGTRSECEQFFISKPDHNNGQSLLCNGGRSRDRLPIQRSKFAYGLTTNVHSNDRL